MTEPNIEEPTGQAEQVPMEQPEHTQAADWLVENADGFNAAQLEKNIKEDFLEQIVTAAVAGDVVAGENGLVAASDAINQIRQGLVGRAMGSDEWATLVPEVARSDIQRIMENPKLQSALAKALASKYDEISAAIKASDKLPGAEDRIITVDKAPLIGRATFSLGSEGSLFIEGTEASKPDDYTGVTEDSLRDNQFTGIEVVALDQYPRNKDGLYDFNGTLIYPEVKLLIVDRSTGKFKGVRAGETVSPETMGKRFDRLVPLKMNLSSEGALTVDKLLQKKMDVVMVGGARKVENADTSASEAARRMIGQEYVPDRSEQDRAAEIQEELAEHAVEQVIPVEPDPSTEIDRIQNELDELTRGLSQNEIITLHRIASSINDEERLRYEGQPLGDEALRIKKHYLWLRSQLKDELRKAGS